jgi:hypothetical protein
MTDILPAERFSGGAGDLTTNPSSTLIFACHDHQAIKGVTKIV